MFDDLTPPEPVHPRLSRQAKAADADDAPLSELLTLRMIRQRFLPLSSRTIFRMISAGEFPKADVAIGNKLRLWRRGTVEIWIEEQAAKTRP